MHKKTLSLLILVIFLLTACNSRTFSFAGETDNWSAELKVNQSSGFQKQEFLLKYKGEDISSIGEIAYHVESVGGFGREGVTLEENGSIRHVDEANPTNAKVDENTKVEVTVEWNGNTETFNLEKK
ncbi:hypothetical protein ACOJQI_00930 [Bacillus salacetis]|uniref:hypothetical protein n=1 Tax=Bacillus salacetis TaxID=2315464 RepID=UPI003B9F7D22